MLRGDRLLCEAAGAAGAAFSVLLLMPIITLTIVAFRSSSAALTTSGYAGCALLV